MQSYDNNDLISTDQGTTKELMKKINDLGQKTTHHVIGHLPDKGSILELNGLRYEITYVDKALGKFHARLLRPKKDQ